MQSIHTMRVVELRTCSIWDDANQKCVEERTVQVHFFRLAESALHRVKTELDEEWDASRGICELTFRAADEIFWTHNYSRAKNLKSKIFRVLELACREWPLFSGDESYPVPVRDNAVLEYLIAESQESPSASIEGEAFYRLDRWDITTQYGRDRRELLDFLIEYFAKLNKEPQDGTEET